MAGEGHAGGFQPHAAGEIFRQTPLDLGQRGRAQARSPQQGGWREDLDMMPGHLRA
jgi:hypothetical protein